MQRVYKIFSYIWLFFFLILKLSSYCSRLRFIATFPVKWTPSVTVSEFLPKPRHHWDVPARNQESPESTQTCLSRTYILDMKDSGTQKVVDLPSVTGTLWLLRVRCKLQDPKSWSSHTDWSQEWHLLCFGFYCYQLEPGVFYGTYIPVAWCKGIMLFMSAFGIHLHADLFQLCPQFIPGLN